MEFSHILKKCISLPKEFTPKMQDLLNTYLKSSASLNVNVIKNKNPTIASNGTGNCLIKFNAQT